MTYVRISVEEKNGRAITSKAMNSSDANEVYDMLRKKLGELQDKRPSEGLYGDS